MQKFLAALTLFSAICGSGFAQDKKKDTLKFTPEKGIIKAAKAVGHKTAEVASKGAAKVADKKYKDKTGPGGETIYIDDRARFYYVDKKGSRVYVTEDQLKDKADQ